uniref:RING-type E3 ubiquitin transferase n=1 Tax=Araucaria cunninghamii TaxID=56994 RepID=A0A0D6QU30_ARACU
MDTDVEVPSYFKCPISMELMRDPVTICTGMTYDRESIEHWIYTCKKKTCPATMQELQNMEFTPNHTLRRLIQGWCVVNSSKGVDRIPTPRPPLDAAQVSVLLQKAVGTSPFEAIGALKKLRSLARESAQNLRCIAASVPAPALISVLNSNCREEIEAEGSNSQVCEEVLGILHLLPVTPESAKLLSEAAAIRSLALILQRGSTEARVHAVTLLGGIASRVPDWEMVIRKNGDLLRALVEILEAEVCHQATVAALDALREICGNSRRNKLKAVEAGAVFALVELLPEAGGLKCERILETLDKLLDCAEGRAAAAEHAMAVAAVSKKIMRVSEAGTRRAVRILWSLCVFSPRAGILRDMIQFGAVSKLSMLLQLDCSSKTKQKAQEVLKLHGKSWSSSPCFPLHFKNDYIH